MCSLSPYIKGLEPVFVSNEEVVVGIVLDSDRRGGGQEREEG